VVAPHLPDLLSHYLRGGIGGHCVPEEVITPRILITPGDYRAGLKSEKVDTPDIRVDIDDCLPVYYGMPHPAPKYYYLKNRRPDKYRELIAPQ
jgi:hypothetical protein